MPVSKSYNLDNYTSVQEFFHSHNWTDGLPIVPPTPEAVLDLLEYSNITPEHLIGIEPVRSRAITAEKLAINAVMAGCLPEHFPLVCESFSAMLKEPFLLHGATASTGGCAVLVIINGPVRKQLGMNGTFNALGSSDRTTTVIGRAIRLILCNLLDARPGDVDRSTLGHPGKISFCIAEDEENTNWLSIAEERDIPNGVSAVTVMAACSPRQIMNEWTTSPKEILDTFVAEIKSCMKHYSIWPGNYAIVIPPQLRVNFEDSGWTKKNIRNYVFKNARIKRKEWSKCGKTAVVGNKGEKEYTALTDENHLLVVAAGGPAGGFGAVIPPWFGTKSKAVTQPIGLCLDCGPEKIPNLY